MPVIFDIGKVMKYYCYAKSEGKVKRRLENALKNFRIEEAIKKAEKLIEVEGNVYLVPCITGKSQVLEIEGEIFVEICLSE